MQQSHLHEAEAALPAVVEQRQQAVEEYRRTRLGELATAEAKAAGLAQDVVKASKNSRLKILRAPVDGTVQQLAVHTVGGGAGAARGGAARQPARDRGDGAELRCRLCPRRAGGRDQGRHLQFHQIRAVARLRTQCLEGCDRSTQAPDRLRQHCQAEHRQRQQPGHEPVYAAHVSLDRTAMEIDGKEVPLSPGMAVTVGIKTGAQRIITYLMSPLLRFKQEALHER